MVRQVAAGLYVVVKMTNSFYSDLWAYCVQCAHFDVERPPLKSYRDVRQLYKFKTANGFRYFFYWIDLQKFWVVTKQNFRGIDGLGGYSKPNERSDWCLLFLGDLSGTAFEQNTVLHCTEKLGLWRINFAEVWEIFCPFLVKLSPISWKVRERVTVDSTVVESLTLIVYSIQFCVTSS